MSASQGTLRDALTHGFGKSAQQVYEQQDAEHRALTDRLFAVLAVVLWAGTILLFAATSHPEILSSRQLTADVLGLAAAGLCFVAIPVAWILRRPGHRMNPTIASIALAVCTVLFMHVSGRSDSLLSAFVVLSFLAFYRRPSSLAIATIIIVANVVFGTLDRHNIFGSLLTDFVSARSEDIFWLLILDLVLYASIGRMSAGIRKGSEQQAVLEALQEESIQSIALRDQQLQESEMVKTIIFESAPDAVIRLDRDLDIAEINSIGEQMLQISRRTAVGRPLSDFVEDVTDLKKLALNRNANGSLVESRVRRADGSQFFAELSIALVIGLTTEQYALFLRDITERKNLESQVTESRKLQSIGQLAAGIAHEINTPTQYVGDNTLFLDDSFRELSDLLDAYQDLEQACEARSGVEESLKKVESTRDRADLEFLRNEIPNAIKESLDGIQRISVIVSALKDFSHPGVEGMSAAELNRILESTATVARNEWKYVADLELDLSQSLPPVVCLPSEIGQVALNLIVNASHAIAEKFGNSGEKGLIKISTSRDGEFVTTRVTDNGGGIPHLVRGRVFDPFFTTKEVGKGTGQGLAIAHTVIVERHQGQLWFETEEGVGTTFYFKIPIDAGRETAFESEAA